MKIIGEMKKFRRSIIFYFKFQRKIYKLRRKNSKIYFCVGSAVHGNMGDQALGYCRHEFLKKIGVQAHSIIEFTSRDEMRFWEQICKCIQQEDIILLRGGGYWGDLWLDGFDNLLQWIKAFPGNKVVVFPQSIFFSNTKEGEEIKKASLDIIVQAKNLHLFARDYASYERLKELYVTANVYVTPDTVLAYKPDLGNDSIARKGVIFCIRKDKESYIEQTKIEELKTLFAQLDETITYQDTSIDFQLQKINDRKKKLEELWRAFASAKMIVTDRLHGMIFATITGTPCIVYDNIDGKIGHQFEWIKNLEYVRFAKEEQDMLALCLELLNKGGSEYPLEKIFPQFEDLSRVVLGENSGR